MAITITQEPPDIHFTKNPVEWRLNTDKYLISPATAGSFKFTVSGAPAIGEEFIINYNGNNVVFVCSASPDDSGLQYLSRAGLWSDALYAAVLVAYFAANYNIDKDFVVSATGADIEFAAKNPGAIYNPTFNTPSWGTFSIPYPGTDSILNENFEIGLDLMVEKSPWSGVYERQKSAYYRVDKSSNLQIDLQKELRSFVSGYDIPPVSLTTAQACVNIQRRYYLVVRECYGAPKTDKKFYNSSTRFCHKGGLRSDNFVWVGRDAFNGLFYPEQMFLKNFPSQKATTKSAKEILYWSIQASSTKPYLMAKIYYDNGSDTGDLSLFQINAQNPETWMFASGFNQLSLFSYTPTGLNPIKYDVWLQDGSPISEIVTYHLIDEEYLQWFVYYENSFGVFELARLTGTRDLQIEVSRKEFEAVSKIDYGYLDNQISSELDSYQFVGEAYTGVYSKSELAALVDFLISSCYIDTGSDFVGQSNQAPFTIMKDTISILRDDDFNYQAKFKFKYGFRELAISNVFI